MSTLQPVIRAAVAAAAVGLAATAAFGYGSYGSTVNQNCPSAPYTGNCSFCHVSDRGAPTEAKSAFVAEDWCYFCPDDGPCSPEPACTDADGDGYFAETGCGTPVDCNDGDQRINPGAAEICTDALDNDCNGAIDGQDTACTVVPPLPCTDVDGDGWCLEDGDCNDADAEVHPGAQDLCLDGIDQDCSGADRTKGKGCPREERTAAEGKGKTCSDGVDNDGNGLTDCEDPACGASRACR